MRHEDIFSFEEIRDTVATAVERLGFTKVRLTGGEPLVRKGIVVLIAMVADISGITDYALTTNGVLLQEYAQDIKRAGIMRVNVSLDSVNPERFCAITRGGDAAQVVRGIFAARDAGLTPIKLNCVVNEHCFEDDARGVQEFGARHGFEVRFIKRMHLAQGTFSVVEGGSGGDCAVCNRVRLSSDGFVYPCLFNDIRFSIRDMGAQAALERAVQYKPERGTSSAKNMFHCIGG